MNRSRVIVSMKRDEVIFSIRSYLSIIVKAISLEIDLSNDCRTIGTGAERGKRVESRRATGEGEITLDARVESV